MRFLKGRQKTKSTNPKLFDECIYTPYSYRKDAGEGRSDSRRRSSGTDRREEAVAATTVNEVHSQPVRRFSDSAIEVEEHTERRREDLLDLQQENYAAQNSQNQLSAIESQDSESAEQSSHIPPTVTSAVDDTALQSQDLRPDTPDFDTAVHIPEVFLFEYGVCVIWGMTLAQEQRFLKEISKFEQEKLGKDDIQTEEFNFYYTREYQARIYNDFISLREKKNYMTKLAISHALAQSTKVSNTGLTVKCSC